MIDLLAETLSKYRPAAGTEDVIRAHVEQKSRLTPETLAEMYARDGQPVFVANYLPFTNFTNHQKAELLIQAYSGHAERLSQLALSVEDYPVLRDGYNQQAAAELQQAGNLAQLLSQLSPSSG